MTDGRKLKELLDSVGDSGMQSPREKIAEQKPLGYRVAKRLFDIVFSSLAIAFLSLPAVVFAFLIWLETRSNPIYLQDRVTYKGRVFKIIKLRSMVSDSDNVSKYLTPVQLMIWNRERKVANDPRVTGFGQWLRATSLDEIPQFINVLKGDMSIVGPRAITEDEVKWFGANRGLLLSVRAGMTGLWQTGSRNNATFVTGERQKIELEYVRKANFWLDMEIILKTILVVIKGSGK